MIRPVNLMVTNKPTTGNNARLVAWNNALTGTKLTTTVFNAYNTFWNSCDGNSNVSNNADLLHVSLGLATNEQHLKPFISTAGVSGTAYNNPTFATTGIKNNGTNSYIDWGWKASANANKYQINNAGNLIFIKTAGGNGAAFGSLQTGKEDSLLFPSDGGICYYSANNNAAAGEGVYTTGPVAKLFFVTRTVSTTVQLWLDNAIVANYPLGSGTLNAINDFEGCINNGTASAFYSGEVCVRGKTSGNFDVASFRTYLYQLASDLGITL